MWFCSLATIPTEPSTSAKLRVAKRESSVMRRLGRASRVTCPCNTKVSTSRHYLPGKLREAEKSSGSCSLGDHGPMCLDPADVHSVWQERSNDHVASTSVRFRCSVIARTRETCPARGYQRLQVSRSSLFSRRLRQ